MAADVHELAPHHLPMFVPSADGSDPLMTIMLVVLIVGIVFAGAFYLHLHSLPERLAHRHNRVQFELVAVMALIALFTHNNVFWVGALLLAFVPIPNFFEPLNSIAISLARMAGRAVPDELDEREEVGAAPSGSDVAVQPDPNAAVVRATPGSGRE